MILTRQNIGADYFSGNNNKPVNLSRFLLLFFVSAAVFAQTNGLVKLPETYRTPLSDMVHEDFKEWRTEPEDENPWREGEEELIVKPRFKAKFFPQYNYDSLYYRDSIEDPVSNSLFQNETEIERPVSNVFQYTF